MNRVNPHVRHVAKHLMVRKVVVVIKMRGGNRSQDIREYVITDKGVMVIHPRPTEYAGLTTGLLERIGQRVETAPEPKAAK